MKILILVSSLNYGGAEKQAVLDANMLAEVENVYLGTFQDGPLRQQLDERVKVVYFQKLNYFSTANRLASFIKKEKVEVVHNHLYAPMIISALASIRAKVPVFWHFHGHHFEVRKWPLNLLSRLPMVKNTVFVCDALAGYFGRAFHFPEAKSTVIYNSSQCRKLPKAKPQDSKLRIGFMGRLVGLKRVEYLIEVAAFLKKKGLPNFEVLIAGDGPERAPLEKQVTERGVSEEVTFLGFRSDIENIYNQLDLFILPSEEEALSLALIDAGRVGLPSLAFDIGGNKEIIKNGETGFIVGSLDELKEKALLLCRDKVLREKMGEKAEQFTRLFSEQNHLQSLLKMYHQHSPSGRSIQPKVHQLHLAKPLLEEKVIREA
ncbi:glycosyltransferase family 4 protein [Nafulsella turpanensis]|uniref:glycosyltransferase family 4 protein n=1 Tax=Nafulsella turpanensis TaxID=1265690 RepID=UPI00034BEAB6|nr:glycosyltransferase family 4 protein [Nafulsella turpanensis]